MKRWLAWPGAILCATGLWGCIGHMEFSKPPNVIRFGDPALKLPGLDLTVEPRNKREKFLFLGLLPLLRRDELEGIKPFMIELVLDPKNDGFSFDPQRIVLQGVTAENLAPVSFNGPARFRHYPAVDKWYCDLTVLGGPMKKFQGPIPIPEKTCFTVVFDTTAPPPEQQFALRIDGIENSGQPFQVPTIHFEKGSVWGYNY